MKNEEILFKNYKKSLKQKYNAVCFDIDGTLTVEGSKSIDDRAIEMIIELMKKKIPVVFITGRGETGLNDLKSDIYKHIRYSENITDNDMKRIYVLTNDGARLFYSQKISEEEFLNKNVYLSTEEELNQLSNVNKLINDLKMNSMYDGCFNITYSKDFKTNKIINIRIIFNADNYEIVDLMFKNIDDFIKNFNFQGIHLTRGIYKNKAVIQIGTATKDKAIERAEKIIGVPKNSMMRIGDCGDLRGNDYAMLNCNQGYSVNKTNGAMNSCFPVFDESGNIIKGVEATLQLVKSAKILPTVCLEKADKSSYQYQFANVEKSIVLGRKKLLNKYNGIINTNFNECNSIDDLFDKFSGSVKIPMYEWELLENNPLKEFWNASLNGNQIYLIRDDNNYLLRGSRTYYYFISNRMSNNGIDFTSKDNILNWHKNYLNFFNSSIQAVSVTNNLNDEINKKLLLGILDNCRNVLLVLLNHNLFSNYYDSNVLLDISSNKESQIFNIYNTLYKVDKIMSKICFFEQYIINKDDIIENIINTKNILEDNLMVELNSEEKSDYTKDYRAYREIDNFGENYVAVSLYKEKSNNDEVVSACGLSYGGIELPILTKIIKQNKVDKLFLLKFNKKVSGYTNKQLIELRNFNINDFGGLVNSEYFKGLNVDLFDDNVLTGKTLQLSINTLYDCNIHTKNICIVRYPSINRINQMFLNNSVAVDYHLFFDYIYGLCFNSPYSWKDNEWKNENGTIDYTDSLGVFDLNRKKIIECLVKNHDFNEYSEVGEYRRRLVK